MLRTTFLLSCLLALALIPGTHTKETSGTGANTEITGLRLEDVVGGMRRVMEKAAHSLRLSELPLQEVARLQEELHASLSRAAASKQRWLEANDLAKYNGLKKEPYLTVPVDLNVVFLGFAGDGHYKLNLAERTLRPWFEHMQQTLPHSFVPSSESSDSSAPQPSHVYFKYHLRVLELHEDVNSVIESLIWDNARPEDPWQEGPAISWTSQDMHQVDIVPVENALTDLVDTLRLNGSYTLFLMNPKLPYPDFNYGYRYGFSQAELDRMHENATLLEQLMGRDKVRPILRMSDQLKEDVHSLHAHIRTIPGHGSTSEEELEEKRRELNKKVEDKSRENVKTRNHEGEIHPETRGAEKLHSRGRPKFKDMRDLSQAWAAIYKQALHDLSYWKRHPAEEVEDADDEELEQAYDKELRTLYGTQKGKQLPPDMMFEVMATRLLQSRSEDDREYIRAVAQDKHVKEDCLVDNWISRHRFAFIDFSSGPFEWGPIVGGKGVRSFRTIPDIISLKEAATDFTAGGQWKDPAYVNKIHRQVREHGIEKLMEEKKMLLVFLNQQCHNDGGKDQGSTCTELRHKLSAVEAFIKTHAKVETESDEETMQHLSFITGGPHEGANISLVQHSMFAKLGSIIQSTQRQLFTPPASAAPAPYAANIHFHVYLITNHNTYKPEGKQHFDYSKFQSELEAFRWEEKNRKKEVDDKVRLPRQKYNFVLHKYSMAEDQALAVAYANALRAAVVATLKVDGRFVATKRMYLDSQVLQKHLQLLHDHLSGSEGAREGGGDGEFGVNKRDIPIFLFSMDAPLPLQFSNWQLVNEGVEILQGTSTNLDNLEVLTFSCSRVVTLQQLHVAVKLSWKKAIADVHRLDFQSALPNVHSALRNARHFRNLARHTQELLLLSSCMHPVHNAPFDWGLVLVTIAAVGCVSIYSFLAPTRTKPKIS
ncbi:hypothetical protein GUITHDRAFT_162074 [Guillardia theta CCMP2712]|uniref:DUF7906 domain-containing protein n=1 Tax=Guillardia theta (strain CCMP2712) TaxID=905079 RepID=L1JNB8_GUITC|nr:hypothetical protein GUITHDRAFT_162074 [Guillardia theta CCMP2712]EKX49685.1 hypothetical protein GUITHDRAFT_162074 [Guillardia theta CCMP2712]|eukprot:XP_005836665.1 hypothetical protein GUITHDRAFT_162074 [Guillardia theta CCMP2712]